MKITKMPDDAKWYVKRPIPVKAIQISEPFEVDTLEGLHKGKAGDYLIQGVKGELYPCDLEIFNQTYREKPTIELDDSPIEITIPQWFRTTILVVLILLIFGLFYIMIFHPEWLIGALKTQKFTS